MTKLVPARSCFWYVGSMDVYRECVPFFGGVARPMRFLQIPASVPLLSVLSVRARVLINREYPLHANDPSDVAHHIQFSGVHRWCSKRPTQTTWTGLRQSFIACTKSLSYRVTGQFSTRKGCSALSNAERETSMP
jgi:hypothetical protein